MSSRNRLAVPLVVVAVLSLAFLVGCGSSSNTNKSTNSGAYSNSNFSGTYTFSTSGDDIDANGNESALTIAGTITACGCSAGTISAGTVDITDDLGPGAGIAVNTSASVYKINADGTGTLTLNFPVSTGGSVNFIFNMVLTDAAHGLIIEFDDNGTGSGTIDLQPNPVALTANSSYAFSVSGAVDATGSELAAAGAFTVGSSGTISGIGDINNSGTPSTGLTLSGSVAAGSGTNPGSASITFGSFGTFTFDVYAIDATHVKLVESDGQAVMGGDLFSQTSTSIPASTLAFNMAGVLPSTGEPYAIGGTVAYDGSSNLSSGAEDINLGGTFDNGATTSYSFSGTLTASPSGSGRYQATLSGFQGGANFVAYPSSGGILLLEIDSPSLVPSLTAGTAMVTSSPSGLAASQSYGMNLSGFDVVNGAPLDQIAQFNTTSSSLSGVLNQNDFTVANPSSQNLSGQYTSSAVGQVILGSSESTVYYAVNGTTALTVSSDPNEVSVGVFEQQGSPSSTADVAPRHMSMMRAAAQMKKARSQKKKQ